MLIQEAVNAASQADVIVAALGESAEMSGEASSRSMIGIPQAQEDLLKALLKTGKTSSTRPLYRPAVDHKMGRTTTLPPSSMFGSVELKPATLSPTSCSARTNPSGKLTTTWPQNVGQIPLYYNHKNTGRPLEGAWFQKFRSNYLDVSNDPVYPFGFGLSYTHFTYSNLTLSSATLKGAKNPQGNGHRYE